MGGLGEFLFGSGDKMKKVETMSPEQQQFLQMMLGQLQGGYGQSMGLLQQYLNPQSDIYQNFEQPYMQEFQNKTLPGIAERFAGAGALSSSGFGQSLSTAGSDLQTNLAAMKQMMQQNAIQSILGQAGLGLGAQPFGYQKQQGHAGFAPTLFGNIFDAYSKGMGMGG